MTYKNKPQFNEVLEPPIKERLHVLLEPNLLSKMIAGTALAGVAAIGADTTAVLARNERQPAVEASADQHLYIDFGLSDFPRFVHRQAAERASRDEERKPLKEKHAEAPVAPQYPSDPRAIGQLLAARHGWTGGEWQCLDTLWGDRESGWDVHAYNSSSGAYGIPQALPGYKMATAGPDWENNPTTQITWGLGYIAGRYGTPCGALAHSNETGWY